jgi:hypothetical protein
VVEVPAGAARDMRGQLSQRGDLVEMHYDATPPVCVVSGPASKQVCSLNVH